MTPQCIISKFAIQKTPYKLQAKYASDTNLFKILMQYITHWGEKNVIIHVHIQKLTYGMHKTVRRFNLEEEEEEGRTRREVTFVSAIAAAATHVVVRITVKSIERNLTV
jgi:hypothetical protein